MDCNFKRFREIVNFTENFKLRSSWLGLLTGVAISFQSPALFAQTKLISVEPPVASDSELEDSSATEFAVPSEKTELDVIPTSAQAEEPLAPVVRPAPGNADPIPRVANRGANPELGSAVESALLGGVSGVDSLPASRRGRTKSAAVDAVLGQEAKSRESTDTGNLIGKSTTVRGVSPQQRTPIVTDTRIRGERVGQVLASGSFWAPVRMDLDTMMSKIDSRLIDNLIIVKGPYSPRYGAGFSFVDIDMLQTPRYFDGPEVHGTSSIDYQTNGQQWYGRQTFYGGDATKGFRVSYGHRAGNDYETGDGTLMPSSYKSGDLNVALGWNATPDDRFEFNYLRLDQSDMEFPGLVYDIRYLVTEAYEIKYTGNDTEIADHVFSEVWYNRTRFEGDTFAQSKANHIPLIKDFLFSPSGVDGAAITNANGGSLGYRSEAIYGEYGVQHLALGTDLNIQRQELNDIEILLPANDNNFPLPRSKAVDFGFYAEHINAPNDWLTTNVGARVDLMNTTSADFVQGVEDPLSDIKDADLDQSFTLWSTYATAEILLTDGWTGTGGVGYGQRPPTLTELYVDNAYIGSLQRGLTFLDGDPLLNPEKLTQIDLGLKADYERFDGAVNAYYAWVHDYITYDLTTPADPDGGLPVGASFVNTDLAILSGIDAYGKYQWVDDVAFFGTLSYTEGTDKSREKPARLTTFPRSSVAGVDEEALPGISPLESRVGIILHDPSPRRMWGVELSTRMVARQKRVATTLEEIETPGFATVDLRTYRNFNDRCLLTAGVENMGDRYYREHLDYRSGLGVYRPGVNFYTGLEFNY